MLWEGWGLFDIYLALLCCLHELVDPAEADLLEEIGSVDVNIVGTIVKVSLLSCGWSLLIDDVG